MDSLIRMKIREWRKRGSCPVGIPEFLRMPSIPRCFACLITGVISLLVIGFVFCNFIYTIGSPSIIAGVIYFISDNYRQQRKGNYFTVRRKEYKRDKNSKLQSVICRCDQEISFLSNHQIFYDKNKD